jgi:hypothetical protein
MCGYSHIHVGDFSIDAQQDPGELDSYAKLGVELHLVTQR